MYATIPPNSSNPDSLIMDRFGNQYDPAALALPANRGQACLAGYYDVDFLGAPPQAAQDVICQVLSDLSALVPQRTAANACGTIPQQNVKLQVAWLDFANPNPGVVAALQLNLQAMPLDPNHTGIGTAFTAAPNATNCQDVIITTPFAKINGAWAGSGYDGRLLLNSLWDWNYDPGIPSGGFPGQMDLYSVVLHEMMHVLGYASYAEGGGVFSLWDQTLRANGAAVLTNASGCVENCWSMDLSTVQELALSTCDLTVGATSVSVGGPASNGGVNLLSHLNGKCPGQGNFLMQGELPVNVARRAGDALELRILCELGYQVPSQGCDGCYNIPQSNFIREANATCCFQTFYVCAEQPFRVSAAELLCDDITNGGPLTVTRMWANSPATMVVDNQNGTWDITVPSGVTSRIIYYTVRGCDCRLANASFILTINQQCPTCVHDTDPCGKIVCGGDFEQYTNTSRIESHFGWPIAFDGAEQSGTPDIQVANDNNHYLRVLNAPNREAVNLPLRDCVQPGCELLMTMDISYDANAPGALEIWASKSRPCPATELPSAQIKHTCGGVGTTCSALPNFFPACAATVPAPNTYVSEADPGLNPSVLHVWKNDTNDEVCYLTLVPSGPQGSTIGALLDNLSVKKRCVPMLSLSSQVQGAICPGSVFALSVQVCAPSVPGGGKADGTLTLTLPNGLTRPGGNNPAAFNLAQGECLTFQFQVQVGAGVPPNTQLSIGLSASAPGVCDGVGNASGSQNLTVTSCLFPCPCTAANTLNIDATTEHRYSVLEAQNNYDKNNDGILDATDHNGCIAITGRLDVDVDLKITGAQTVRMQSPQMLQPNPGASACAEIAVVQNTTTGNYAFLTLDGNNFYGCNRMWRGITVNPHCGLRASGNDIYDAEFGVRAMASSSGLFTLAPSTEAYLTDNGFYRNHVGVMFDGTNAGGFASVYHAPFSGNTFDGAGPLLPSCSGNLANYSANKGYAGFVTLGVSAAAEFDKFMNLRNGIIGENTWLDAIHCEFFEVLGGVSHSGTFPDPFAAGFSFAAGIGVLHKSGLGSITACDFHNVDLGVFGKDNLMAVTDNYMQDVIDGVISVGSLGLAVLDNPAISFRETGVEIAYPIFSALGEAKVINNTFTTLSQAFSGIAAYYGNNTQAQEKARIASNDFNVHYPASSIWLTGSNNWLLDGNYTNASNLPENANFESYRLEDSHNCQEYGNGAELSSSVGQIGSAFYTDMSASNLFCCNYSNGFNTGMTFEGACEHTVLRRQSMRDHEYSIRCGQATTLGLQPENSNDNHSNEFLENGSVNAGIALHEGGENEIKGSRFRVMTAQAPDHPIAVSTPNSSEPWFLVSGNPNTTCAGSCPPPNPWGNIPQTAIAYALGTYMAEPMGDVLTWEGQLHLYERLAQQPELLGNDTLANFYNVAQTGAIGAFAAAENTFRQLDALPDSLAETWAQHLTTAQAANNAVATQRASLAQCATELDSLTVYQRIDSLRRAALPAIAGCLEAQTQLRSLRTQRAEALLPQVAQLPAGNLWQNNRKAILRLYLQTVGIGIDSLDAQQFAEVSAIAHQCPKVGGSAVFRARALYQMRERKRFDNDDLCAPVEERNRQATAVLSDGGLALRPNPATETLSVEVSGEGLTQLAFFDAQGRRIHLAPLAEKQQTATVDVRAWPQGVYFCQVMGGRGIHRPVKFIVQH